MWTLILIYFLGTDVPQYKDRTIQIKTVTSEHIDGFKSKENCIEAGKEAAPSMGTYTYRCINVK